MGVVYIPKSRPLIWGGGEGGVASPVSGKGNKGPLCPVGVGPCCHGHRTSPLTGTCRAGLKVGGGGKEGSARSNRGWLVMWWQGGGQAPYLLLKMDQYSTYSPPCPVAQLRPTGLHRKDTSGRMDTYTGTTRLSSTFHSYCPPLLRHNTIRGGVGHMDVLNAHSQPVTLQYAEVMSEWTPCRLVSAALSQASHAYRNAHTRAHSTQWATFNTCVWITSREFQTNPFNRLNVCYYVILL